MKNSLLHSRLVPGAVIALVALGSLLAGPGPGASAATCTARPNGQPPSPGAANELRGVAVLSPCNAWAVGDQFSKTGAEQTLIEHWDGTAWTVVPGPNLGDSDPFLTSVDATSANDIWAVGEFGKGNQGVSLTLHWNGTAWTLIPSPPSGGSELTGVSAVSATDAWAVGQSVIAGSARRQPLILHWNGTAWTPVPSPFRTGDASDFRVTGVSAISHNNAWITGNDVSGPGNRSFILHWNGLRWTQVPSPHPAGGDGLSSVAATSPFNAWAVGSSGGTASSQTFILHWNGFRWTQVPSPDPAGSGARNALAGVATSSPFDAWAVGQFDAGTGTDSLVLHWNGLRWVQVNSPSPGKISDLFAVGTSSPADAWAVGTFTPGQALAIHLGLGSLLTRTGRAAMAPGLQTGTTREPTVHPS